MNALRYLAVLIFGALGTLALLRALERVVFGGGQGSLLMQFGFGVGFIVLAARTLRAARAARLEKAAAAGRSARIG